MQTFITRAILALPTFLFLKLSHQKQRGQEARLNLRTMVSQIALISVIVSASPTLLAGVNGWAAYVNVDINSVSLASGSDDTYAFMYFPTTTPMVGTGGSPSMQMPVSGQTLNAAFMNKQTYALLLAAKMAGKNISGMTVQEQATGVGINDVGVVMCKIVNLRIDK